MHPRRRPVVVTLAIALAAAVAVVLARPPSALARYDRVAAGMTAADAEAALGGLGEADPGDTTGKFLFDRAERFAQPDAGTRRRYWRFPDGLVVLELASGGEVVGKTFLR